MKKKTTKFSEEILYTETKQKNLFQRTRRGKHLLTGGIFYFTPTRKKITS